MAPFHPPSSKTHDRRSDVLVLELRELTKHYPVGDGEPVRAVDGVSLQVAAGELVALYGPSGSGKTTLLMLIAALLAPDSGAVIVDGREISALSDDDRARYRLRELGYIDQAFDLLPGGTVRGERRDEAVADRRTRAGPSGSSSRCWCAWGWASAWATAPTSSRWASASA